MKLAVRTTPLTPLLLTEGEWTGERELSVVPGYDAYVVPDANSSGSCSSPLSCIALLEGGITTEAFAMLSSVGATPVLAPDNPLAVSTVLVAPQVRKCGRLGTKAFTSNLNGMIPRVVCVRRHITPN